VPVDLDPLQEEVVKLIVLILVHLQVDKLHKTLEIQLLLLPLNLEQVGVEVELLL
jgi:hypothetical protein